jgi:putative membrane protein
VTLRRWPTNLYGEGEEPDPRFSLANERTFLAWTRTALALIAAGIALDALRDLIDQEWMVNLVAIVAFTAGLTVGFVAFARWYQVERAMRLGRPLPAPLGIAIVVLALLILGVIGLGGMLVGS